MLKIKRPLYEALLHHAREVYPEEACGFLAGSKGTVHTLYVIENWLHSRTAYEMEPTQQIKALIEIEEKHLDTFVIYHSHPDGPAYPSETDLARATYPRAIYLIASLEEQQPQVGAFRIQKGEFNEISWQTV